MIQFQYMKQVDIEWGVDKLEHKGEMEYLASLISLDGRMDAEINNRFQKANQFYYQINHTLIGKKNKRNKKNVYL